MDDTKPNHDTDFNRPARELLLGGAAGLVLAGLIALPVVVYAYRHGKDRGREAEQRRMLSREEAVRTRPLVRHAGGKREKAAVPERGGDRPERPGRRGGQVPVMPRPDDEGILTAIPKETAEAEAPAEADGPRGPRCLTPEECVRIVWPMEIVDHDTEPGFKSGTGGAGRQERPGPPGKRSGRRMFRIRQGANRFARPGSGLCEFAFRAYRQVVVSVYVRIRYSDECGNSLVVSVDGGGGAVVGRTKVFGKWLWECAHRRFAVRPGLHRLTVFTREDGVEFDRIVVSTRVPGPEGPHTEYLDGIEPTPAPAFETLPVASAVLPEIGPVTAEAMPTDSLVAGEGHRNTLTVFTRLNGDRARTIRIAARGALFSRPVHEFRLTPESRTRLTEIEIVRLPPGGYLRPVKVEVYADGVRVHSRVVNLVNPLDWAFLGPFPDPERKGLDLALPPDEMAGELHLLPEVPGFEWITVTDGSCYDEFGVVDLNRVFGLDNVLWTEKGKGCDPMVAYAVTCLPSPGARHACFAYAGDDCLRVWINGRIALSQDGNAPLETTRQVIGTRLEHGLNRFVFKVPQTGYHWQILFEPDTAFPYSHPEAFRPLPMKAWKHLGEPQGRSRPAPRPD